MYVVRDLSKNAQHGVLLSVARVWDMRDIVSTFRKMSTKPDQAQIAKAVENALSLGPDKCALSRL